MSSCGSLWLEYSIAGRSTGLKVVLNLLGIKPGDLRVLNVVLEFVLLNESEIVSVYF